MTDRDALLAALIGRPRGLPDPASLDLQRFWTSFETRSPVHLRFGFGTAFLVLAGVLPRVWYGRPFGELDAVEREDLVARAARVAALMPLVEVAKVVACFAYFDDPSVDRAVRANGSSPRVEAS